MATTVTELRDDEKEELDRLSDDEITTVWQNKSDQLYTRFLKEGSSELSLNSFILRLTGKIHLEPPDIVDYGVHRPERPRYTLRTTLRQNIEETITKLQTLLRELAYEVPRRRETDYYFRIDPMNDLVPALQGTETLVQLQGLWGLLRTRIERGSRFILRYVWEAREGAQLLDSPASTAPDIYSQFKTHASLNERLEEMHTLIPAHRKEVKGNSGDTVSWTLSANVPIFETLTKAFPEKLPDNRPTPYSYTNDGLVLGLTHLAGSSSYGSPAFDVGAGKKNITRPSNVATPVGQPAGIVRQASKPSTRPLVSEKTDLADEAEVQEILRLKDEPRGPVLQPPPLSRRLTSADTPLVGGRNVSPRPTAPPPDVVPSHDVLYGAASAALPSLRRPARPLPTPPAATSQRSPTGQWLDSASRRYEESMSRSKTPRFAGVQDSRVEYTPVGSPHRASTPRDRSTAQDPRYVAERTVNFADQPEEERSHGYEDDEDSIRPPYRSPPPPGGDPGDNDDPSGGRGGGPPRGWPRRGNPGDRGPAGPPGGAQPPWGSGPPDGGDNDPSYGNPYARGWDYFHKKPSFLVPRMESKLKIADIPEWDGSKSTAIEWITHVQEFAGHGGYIPWQMAEHLYTRLKADSRVRRWYMSLTEDWKAWMKQYYKNFLKTIIDYYLGERWQQARQSEYDIQRFRQRGHEHESPLEFINRRLLYARLLLNKAVDSQAEVMEVISQAPVSWRAILAVHSVDTMMELQARVSDSEDQLIEASRAHAGNVVTKDNLVKSLLDAGLEVKRRDGAARPYFSSSQARPSGPRRAQGYLSSVTGESNDSENLEGETIVGEAASEQEFMLDTFDDPVAQEAYATVAKRQRPRPKDGYPYKQRDDVVSALKLPPSPCKCCGSPKHWDRECPYYAVWEAKYGRNRTAHLSETAGGFDPDLVYSRTYEAMIIQASSSLYNSSAPAANRTNAIIRTPLRKVTIEEVEDEEVVRESQREHSEAYLLERVGEATEPGSPAATVLSTEQSIPVVEMPPVKVAMAEPPPAAEEVRWLKPRRKFAAGNSAVGISVVAVSGRVGSLGGPEIDLRLDSCADISLISSDLYRSLPSRPKLKQGPRLKLWQLTDKNAELEGYAELPVFVTLNNGETIGLTAEVFVVPNMTVPLLLGEDFHVSYEIGVKRNVEFGTTVTFGDENATVTATGVRRTGDFHRLRKSAAALASFIKAKLHRRNKAKRARMRSAWGKEKRVIRVAEDTIVKPQSCKRIRVEHALPPDQDWFIEKGLLGDGDVSQLAIPNILINSEDHYLAISNPSLRPKRVRKGEVLAVAVLAADYLDGPRTEAEGEVMAAASHRVAALVRACKELPSAREEGTTWHMDSHGVAHVSVAESSKPTTADPGEEDDAWGPKTAEVPDPTVYDSRKLKETLDVGDLPDSLKERAWEMLEKRSKAFAFDGRLGHLDTKARIRTKDGLEPIAIPMYASSPAKKLVIDEQLKTWFAQGVIEPSESPWSAPVVIVYRNGKARFCVDYRKLNAGTIPDEFPLPRQSEILSALSGAQVLSSLDALSGFTQIEVADEDVEKTAFRTHRGLFQFRRMPFGLRNGPSIFQRVMQNILAPYLWLFTLVYIDDIVVYSKSYEEHIEQLDKVLGAIEKAGLTLSPKKCHMFYRSILLLGHKVSRLGLSTHEEKVRAILELQRPTKVSELQTFLGMVVYFSAFIPYYAGIAAPLFALLRKGAKWTWGAEEEYAFEEAKRALRTAPVLGHPIEGKPYRLYTDASDEALGVCLQQVQAVKVKDLAGTKVFERLKESYEKGEDPPKLVVKLSEKATDHLAVDKWGDSLEESEVHVERVVGYWSRTFRDAERRYSATEREALAAKEGLIKFQPFIEGESITLVTDHAALQWARTYENSNRRLAAWGAVYSAFAPGLEIVHRPGRKHSNVDPLSRLPRAAPEHISPLRDGSKSLELNEETAKAAEWAAERAPAVKAGWIVESWEELVERQDEASVRIAAAVTRAASKKLGGETASGQVDKNSSTPLPPTSTGKLQESHEGTNSPLTTAETTDKLSIDPYTSKQLWEATNPPPTLYVELPEDTIERYQQGYQSDQTFKERYRKAGLNMNSRSAEDRFYRDERGLLFFRDADFRARLCVPRKEQAALLRIAHESPYLTAHAGPEKLWESLSAKFYWPRMKKDVLTFCNTCDVCQKTKPRNFTRYGRLTPNPIPTQPYESVSLDLIVGLPWSEGFNAILVIVDRLTKHVQFIPTTSGLSAVGFADAFVKNVVCRFGLPSSLISDRDPRWTSDFWAEVTQILQLNNLLSSSHHPQHDGQTEVVNRQLEIMLRAYVAEDLTTWARWLPLLEHAFNNTVHGSTGASPYLLLYGFEPRSYLTEIARITDVRPTRGANAKAFLEEMAMHRESARRAIARAQVKQANSFNRGRRTEEFSAGDWVLVNPHTLEWKESKTEGKKLVQRWIGPFEVQQRIGENTYRLRLDDRYPGSPVFNLEHLRRYRRSPAELGERTELPSTRQEDAASEEYEVEKIVGHQFDKSTRKMRYLVRWAGYPPTHDEWKTALDLKNAPEILHEYRKRFGVK